MNSNPLKDKPMENVASRMAINEVVKAPEKQVVRILGTRGIPAKHGGFETFAEHFAVYLAERGWEVVVYCQVIGRGSISYGTFGKIRTVHIPSFCDSPIGTFVFDFRAILHAASREGVCLTLGYNTAVLNVLLLLFGRKTAMNMDGIEWKRSKWSLPYRIWLRFNEWVGAKVSNVLIADHPEIAKHLTRHTKAEKITTIAYGAEQANLNSTDILTRIRVDPKKYAIIIARPEPENSILEIVSAWSLKPRGVKLVVLGKFSDVPYHKEIQAAAGEDVIFPGAIYGSGDIATLRREAICYLHGHQVGGTNPSLVEALAYGNPVLAHDNRFNRWVAGDAALYFNDIPSCSSRISEILNNEDLQKRLSASAILQHESKFKFEDIHKKYEKLIIDLIG